MTECVRDLRVGDKFVKVLYELPEPLKHARTVTRLARRNEFPWPSEVADVDYLDVDGIAHCGTFDPGQSVQVLA